MPESRRYSDLWVSIVGVECISFPTPTVIRVLADGAPKGGQQYLVQIIAILNKLIGEPVMCYDINYGPVE